MRLELRAAALAASLLSMAALSSCKNPQLVDAAVELRREELSVSMLVVNLRDAYNEPNNPTPALGVSNPGIPWQERFRRVAQWISSNEPPDVLVIQEMPGYWEADLVQDYEAAFFLIDKIRQQRGVEYRIAYLLSWKQGAGHGDWFVGDRKRGMLPARGGEALLYRPDKIRNTQRAPGLAYNTTNNAGSGLLNSIPCCNVRPGTETVCGLIDGPMVTATVDNVRSGANRSCGTPAGAAFTRRQSTPAGPIDATFSRLELRQQPGNFIDVYNVHFSDSPAPDNNLEALVGDVEQQVPSAGGRLYPPIIAGDFNLDTAAMDYRFNDPSNGSYAFYSRLSLLHWSPEVMGVLIGKDDAFPSKQRAIVRGTRDLPDFGCKRSDDGKWTVPTSSDSLWSDHCASIYFKLVPALDRPL